MEALIASMMAAGPCAKRPPHKALAALPGFARAAPPLAPPAALCFLVAMSADYLWTVLPRLKLRALSGKTLLVGVALAAIVAISAPQSSAQTAPPMAGTV